MLDLITTSYKLTINVSVTYQEYILQIILTIGYKSVNGSFTFKQKIYCKCAVYSAVTTSEVIPSCS